MLTKNEENWRMNYLALRSFIVEHGHLPDKRHVENRRLLNWWKYNQKRIKEGKLSEEKRLLIEYLQRLRRENTTFTRE